ncbi:MAG: hypothetical protein WAX23_11965 [Methanosarcina sp.]
MAAEFSTDIFAVIFLFEAEAFVLICLKLMGFSFIWARSRKD